MNPPTPTGTQLYCTVVTRGKRHVLIDGVGAVRYSLLQIKKKFKALYRDSLPLGEGIGDLKSFRPCTSTVVQTLLRE